MGGEEKENPVPVEEGRKGLVRKVFAGGGRALLARAEGVEWLSNQVGLRDRNYDNGGDDPRNLPGVESVAFGQDRTLVLRKTTCCADSDETGSDTKTEVLSWGSGEQGQVLLWVLYTFPVCTGIERAGHFVYCCSTCWFPRRRFHRLTDDISLL